MRQPVQSVKIVSDGIVIEFADGTAAYFGAEFLAEHIGQGSNHIFLSYDPSPENQQNSGPSYPIC